MARQTNVYLFGDQTNSFDTGLRRLLLIKENVILTSFFERVHYALRLEIGKLGVFERELFPRFTSTGDLLARYRESENNPALESALTAIHQLGSFICHYGEGSRAYPQPSESLVAGMCSGLFAASAVSTAQTVSELVPIAIDAVLLAFRTGLYAIEVRDRVEKDSPASSSWSTVIPGIQEATALAAIREFCETKNLPLSSQPYISAISGSSLTFSGPPQILELLIQSSQFKGLKPIRVSIHAPYHAAHLYDETDYDAILDKCSAETLDSRAPRIPLLSSVTGKLIHASTYRALLRVVLAEILSHPIRWDKALEGCTALFKTSNISRCTILPVATNAAQSLASALRELRNVEIRLDNGITNGSANSETTTGRQEQSKIAIVGLSGRFPDAASPDAFWDLLHQGLDVHREIPPDRFDVKTHVDLSGKKKNASQVPYGCFIKEPGLFDARFFNMSPKEAAQADPAQRLAILTAYEALEMSGFVPDRTPSSQRDRVGIFYGMTSDDWREVNSGQDVGTYFIPGGNRAFTPGRINYHFKFSGPSVSVDTACSSSLAAIHMACNSLWKNDCDTALAGGTNLMTNPDNFTGLDKGHFLSRTGNCKTFDDGADGYCRADAVGTVVLKRLEDALADKDPIQGVINGAYTNHSAEADSITRPHVGAQSFIFSKVLNDAGMDPLDVSYIEMHGTGTQAGDAVEMKSVLDVFASGRNKRDAKHPLYLGSAKSNVGHAESASGVTSLVKVLMMMKQNEIPPHCGIKTKINHNFPTDLEARGIRIAMKATRWERPEGGKRRVFLNNFSAAGGNTALLLEDAPVALKANGDQDSRPTHLVALSAKSIPSLMKNIEALTGFINANPDTSLSNLSYTTTARRIHHNHRVIVSGSDLDMVKSELQAAALRQDQKPARQTAPPNVAFAFTGQGSQYAGMGKQLFQNFSLFRADIRRFDKIGKGQGFPSIQPLIDGTVEDVQGLSPLELQLALTYLQMALARLWISWGAKPSVVVGHSLGEYAALNVAGVLSASDTIYLVGKRAQLLQEQCTSGTHSMLAVKASASVLRTLTGENKFELSCINSPDQTVISGTTSKIDEVYADLVASGIKCTKLAVPFAFHSSQVQPILGDFEDIARGVTFHKPTIPVVSPLLATVMRDTEVDAAYLSRHCREAVDFVGAIEAAKSSNCVTEKSLWIEMGPDTVATGMVKTILGPKTPTAASLRRKEDTWKVLTGTLSMLHLAGIDLQWSEYHRDFSASHTVLQLPAYRWDYKNHWIQYVHDWCLTKGDPPLIAPAPTPAPALLAPPKFKSLSSAVQRIIEENVEDSKATVVMESDCSEPDMKAVFQGHKVNGVTLCPSSLYADVAFTLGDYLRSLKPDAKYSGMDVCNMVVGKSLVGKEDGSSQLFRTSATADWKSQTAHLVFYSVNAEGKKTIEHATCMVKYSNTDDWIKEWNRSSYLVKSRIDQLRKEVDNGQSHKIKRGMAYKLFGATVQYDQKFRGMEEVILNSSEYEGTAKVVFQATDKDGNFYRSPYWLDSMGHLSGFIMNANDEVDSKTQVFINHGWESMRCSIKLSSKDTYQTYVKMQSLGGTLYAGDVYMFKDGQIIGCNQGVKFQGIPRKILDTVFKTPVGGTKASPSPVGKLTAPAPTRPEKPKLARKSVATPKAKPEQSAPTATTSAIPSIVTKALAIVAEEIGVPVSDLSNDSAFADFGVDSLLSLNLSGRFREELEIDVESSFFVEYPTVSEMKKFFSGKSEDTNEHSMADEPMDESSTGQSTPDSYSDESSAGDGSVTSLEGEGVSPMDSIALVLAEEIGVSVEEIRQSEDLAELGMDSLMSLTVLGRLRETLGMDLPSEFFTENATVGAIESTLGFASKAKTAKSAPRHDSLALPTAPLVEKPSGKKHPPATSILLQGNLKTASKTLFLFPDGSGSSTSYATLPRIGSDIAVVGLNCPYMKTPQDLTCDLASLTPPYVAEIRRRQPKGPYHFSGWSAGGICAYDAAQYLMREGEEVASLILLDSPFPIGLSKLPQRLYHFLNSCGLFGTGDRAPPEWLLPHFLAFVDALALYDAKPFAPGTAPKTSVIWARDGVYRSTAGRKIEDLPSDPKEMRWLLNNRTDFGPNGWNQLVGDSLIIDTMADANHFTMMEGEKGKQLSAFIARSMA